MSEGHSYLLGHSEVELERLAAQARAVDPITQRFFTEAGVVAGMRVLDVGCGGGDVSLLVAGLVGSTGSVVGFDNSRGAVEAARVKFESLSMTNVTFVAGARDSLRTRVPSTRLSAGTSCSSSTTRPRSSPRWRHWRRPVGLWSSTSSTGQA